MFSLKSNELVVNIKLWEPYFMKIAQFNVENLFLYLDNYKDQDLDSFTEDSWQALTSSNFYQKPLKKTSQIANIIKEIDAEVYILNEVGGTESIKTFCKLFLNDSYTYHLIEGNSDRGIDVGFLVKKDSAYEVSLSSNKDLALEGTYYNSEEVLYMSRDIPELHLKKDGDTKLIVLGVHLKSRLDPEFKDPQGKLRRKLESNLLAKVYNKLSKEYPNTLILIAGDFNGEINEHVYNEEFTGLKKTTDLVDAFDIASVPREKRITQVMISRHSAHEHFQFDHILISKNKASQLVTKECHVHYFRNDLGLPEKLPESIEEKQRLPSDHYPVVIKVKL